MAFANLPVAECTIELLARNRRKTTCQFGIKLGGAVTEATARAKLASIATLIQAATGAMVLKTKLLMRARDETVTIDPIENQPYRAIEDRAELGILPVGSGSKVTLSLPGPVTELFESARKELVNASHEGLQTFLTWAKTVAVDYGKRKLSEYVGGQRERGRIRRELPGQVPLLPP